MSEKILLHTCCAPCSIAVIDELRASREVVVFFYNPNIYPAAEYDKRKAEVVRVCREWGIRMIDADHEPQVWEEAVGVLGAITEGGSRCAACCRLRLAAAAARARDLGIAVFATSLSSGRQKNSSVINDLGRAIAGEFGLIFLDEDWKKKGRSEKARQLVAERGIYRQRYCGCRYSLAAAEISARGK
ncbi:MAG: epoxyqueuosine reductase QueH [Patescibacteria group bacterium]|jgi:hypothetical protein